MTNAKALAASLDATLTLFDPEKDRVEINFYFGVYGMRGAKDIRAPRMPEPFKFQFGSLLWKGLLEVPD